MRILQIIPSLEVGGAERVVEGLSLELSQRPDITLKIISLYHIESPLSKRLIRQGINVWFLDKKPGFDTRTVRHLRTLIRDYKPDVIHVHLYALTYVSLASAFLNIPVKVYTVHSMAKEEVGAAHRLIYRFAFQQQLFTPVAISQEVKQSVMHTYGLGDHRVPVIDNGIELSGMTRKRDYKLHDVPVLIHVASFKPAKNHTMLLESFKQVLAERPAKLRLVGDGPLMDQTKQLVQQMGLEQSVEFLGQRDDVAQLLTQSDIMVLPSAWEGQPITVIEAMAAGLPVVATEVGGLTSLIQSGVNGLLTPVEPGAFAQATLQLLADEDQRHQFGQAAHQASQHHSASQMSQRYYELYRSTLDQK